MVFDRSAAASYLPDVWKLGRTRLTWNEEVVGSNPVVPINSPPFYLRVSNQVSAFGCRKNLPIVEMSSITTWGRGKTMAKAKKVGFNFFKPCTTVRDGERVIINLKPIFDVIREKYEEEKRKEEENRSEWKYVYEYKGEPARLSDITLDSSTGYYHLIFERLDYVLPNYTTLHGESKALELEDDEFIGREVSILYDPENHIMMIQRNKDSLGPSAIGMFIRTLLIKSETAENFDLVIITDTTARRRAFNQKAYRKFQLKVIGAAAEGLVEKLHGHKVDGIDSVEITFSSSSKKKDKIDDGFSKEILDEYVGHREVTKFKIRAREEDEGIIEPIDLIDHKMLAYTVFRFEQDRSLNPISVFEEMVRIYSHDERGAFKNKILRM